MSITVEELLQIPELNNLKCCAGKHRLNNLISGITILENPDLFNWLKGGEFIITTGYVIKDNPLKQESLIDELYNRGCSGIGFKINRYFNEIPSQILLKGNELGLPIIEIPYTFTLSEISELLHRRVFDEELKEEIFLNEMYRALINIVLEEKGMKLLVQTLADIINSSIIITNGDFESITIGDFQEDNKELEDYMNLQEGLPVFNYPTVEKLRSKFMDTKAKVTSQTLVYGEKSIECIIYPIDHEDTFSGYICIPQTKKILLIPQYKLIEKIVPIIKIEMLRLTIANKTNKKLKSDFVTNVLMGNITDQQEIVTICNFHGFDYSSKRVCIFIKPNKGRTLNKEQGHKNEQFILATITQVCKDYNILSYKMIYNDNVILFLFFNQKEDSFDANQIAISITENIKTKMDKYFIRAQYGIGKAYASIETISKSFKQAIKAINLGEKINANKDLYSYYNDFIYYVLYDGFSYGELSELYDETVKKLDDLDSKKNGELICTLKCLFECNLKMSTASQILHIHRNTLSYRVDKIKSILGIDFTNVEENMRIQMGLYAKQLIEIYDVF